MQGVLPGREVAFLGRWTERIEGMLVGSGVDIHRIDATTRFPE